MSRGVPQGSPLSPTLFDIYTDGLIEQAKQDGVIGLVDIVLFADDVIAYGPNSYGLQFFLHLCDRWASSHGMKWAIGKCSAFRGGEDKNTLLLLNGNPVKDCDDAVYLGISMCYGEKGIKKSVERIRNASRRLTQMTRSFRR